MKWVAALLGAFLVSAFVLFPFGGPSEFLLLAIYIAVAWKIYSSTRRVVIRAVAVTTCLLAIGLHLSGFKLYGKPVLADIYSLKSPKRAVGIEPPNLVRFEDGSTAPIAHVFILNKIDFTLGESNNYGVFFDRAGIHQTLYFPVNEQRWPLIQIEAPSEQATGLITLRRANYWCGNTWFPHFQPSRLPRWVKQDFGTVLIECGLAFPVAEHVKRANPYHDPLLNSMHRASWQNLPVGDSQIEALSIALANNRHLDAAVELLMEIKATNALRTLKLQLDMAASAPPDYFSYVGVGYAGVSNRIVEYLEGEPK